MNRNRYARRGVTLIEIMVSLVLVSTLLLVSLTASANLIRGHTEGERAVDAAALGHQILDEVTALDFEDQEAPTFGLEAGESANSRQTFDDVDDYHGYTSKPPTHRDGSAIVGFESWVFSVAITPAALDSKGIVTSGDKNSPLRMVTVTCTAPDGSTSDYWAIVSSVPSDLTATTTVEKWRRLTLRFKDQDLTITAPMRNTPDAI